MLLKTSNFLFISLISFLIIGCNDISPKETRTQRGLLFKIGEPKPYTGTVSGYAREGYRTRKMRFERRYKKGLRHGDTKYWYPNGKLESIEPYTHGKVNGVITRFYENGRIKARIHIVNDRRGGAKGEQFWDMRTKDFGLF